MWQTKTKTVGSHSITTKAHMCDMTTKNSCVRTHTRLLQCESHQHRRNHGPTHRSPLLERSAVGTAPPLTRCACKFIRNHQVELIKRQIGHPQKRPSPAAPSNIQRLRDKTLSNRFSGGEIETTSCFDRVCTLIPPRWLPHPHHQCRCRTGPAR